MRSIMSVMLYEDVKQDKKNYASVFAEGNPCLERVLRYCFDNDIETYACCKGHIEDKISFPYIGFSFDPKQKELYYKIISLLLNGSMCSYITLNFSKYKGKYRLILSLKKEFRKDRQIIDSTFRYLYNCLRCSQLLKNVDSFYVNILDIYMLLLANESNSLNSFNISMSDNETIFCVKKEQVFSQSGCVNTYFLNCLSSAKSYLSNSDCYFKDSLCFLVEKTDIDRFKTFLTNRNKTKRKIRKNVNGEFYGKSNFN